MRLIDASNDIGLRPHDLLWLEQGAVLHGEGPLPDWATVVWRAQAPAVVRRAMPAGPGRMAVGLRGRARHERWAAVIDTRDVLRTLSPEAVLQSWRCGEAPPVADRPCLRTLDVCVRALRGLPLVWGVTGGAGFALATGIDVLREDSDLDLLVRAPARDDGACLRDIATLLNDQPSRIDVQVETPAGAFALIEWLRTGGPVLLKTDRGPALCEDPWA